MAKDMDGSKKMSSERMKLSSGEKMSSKQVLTRDPGKSYAMRNEGSRLGANKATFSKGLPSEAPCNIKK